jgi:hypothetical protein
VVGEIQGRGVLAGVGTPSQNTQASKSERADGLDNNYQVSPHRFYKKRERERESEKERERERERERETQRERPRAPAVEFAEFDVGRCNPL